MDSKNTRPEGMTRAEFDRAMINLINRFPKGYNDTLKTLLYARFKRLPFDAFFRSCNRMALYEKFAPMAATFESSLIGAIQDLAAKDQVVKYKCHICKGDGVLTYLEEWGKAEVAGRCECLNAERYTGLPLMNIHKFSSRKKRGDSIAAEEIRKLMEEKHNQKTEGFKEVAV